MKNRKKFGSLVLALLLTLAMSVSVFAAGAGTSGDPYIGSGDLGDVDLDGTIVIHKYDTATWEKFINDPANKPGSADPGYTIKYFPNEPTGAVLQPTDAVGYYYLSQAHEDAETPKQPVFLQDLTALSNIVFRIQEATPKAGKQGSDLVADYDIAAGGVDSYGKTENGVMTWTGVPRGYYIVTEIVNDTTQGVIDPFVITMPMMDPTSTLETPVFMSTVHIYPKNKLKSGPPVVKEYTTSHENGDTVSWKITAGVPDSIASSEKYDITDKMSTGLTFVTGSLEVYYENSGVKVDMAATTHYTFTTAPGTGADAGKTILKVSFTAAGRAALADADDNVYITYDTKVNLTDEEWAALLEVSNDVVLEFTNEDGNDFETKVPPVVIDKIGAIRIVKIDGTTLEPLAGVKFKVYTALLGTGEVDPASVVKAADGVSDLILVTNAEGKASLNGIVKAGTYYIVEFETVGKYKLLEGHISATFTDAELEANKIVSKTVENYLDNTLTLPKTGGAGTMWFTIIGVGLIAIAGVAFIVSKKRKA